MINLLPPIQKQELKNEKLRKRIIFILFLILSDLLLLIAIVFGLYIYTSNNAFNLSKEIIQKEQLIKEPQFQAIKKVIESANQNLYKINSIKKEQVSVVNVLEKLNQLVPSGAYLKSFSFQNSVRDIKNEETKIVEKEFFGKIRLSGVAKSREIVFSFKKSLSQDKNILDIYFDPLSWIKSSDAEFITEFNYVNGKAKN